MSKLIDVQRRPSGGWEWTVEWDRGDRIVQTRYRTDGDGDGLWVWGTWNGDIDPSWRQEAGTAQYSLRADTLEEAIRILQRRYKAAYEPQS